MKLVKKIEYESRLPNITNSIDMIHVNTDAITNSILNSANTNTIAFIPTDNLTRSYPFTVEPRRPLFNKVSKLNISQMRISHHRFYSNIIVYIMKQSEFKRRYDH